MTTTQAIIILTIFMLDIISLVITFKQVKEFQGALLAQMIRILLLYSITISIIITLNQRKDPCPKLKKVETYIIDN